jgi:MFS family permease
VGTLLAGLSHGGLYASASLYGVAINLSVAEISKLSAITLLVGVMLQWPIAIISDRVDRRLLLVITAALATAPAIYFSLRPVLSVTETYVAVGATGAFVLGLYSQCVAHVNDHLKSSQIVSAAGALVLTYGIGYAVTPVIIGFLLPVSPRFFILGQRRLRRLTGDFRALPYDPQRGRRGSGRISSCIYRISVWYGDERRRGLG